MLNIEPIKLGAHFLSFKSVASGGLKLTFETNEIPAEVGASLMALKNTFGWLIFAANGHEEVEIPAEPAKEFKNDKSPSQRLRAVMFLVWKKYYEKDEPNFENYYKSRMEKAIDTFKESLT